MKYMEHFSINLNRRNLILERSWLKTENGIPVLNYRVAGTSDSYRAFLVYFIERILFVPSFIIIMYK